MAGIGKRILKKILWLSVIIGIALLIKTFAIQPIIVLDKNMEPTLRKDRIYVVDKLTYRFRRPLRGEIVLFRTTEEPPLYFIKRVVGVAGEKISIEEGKVFIDGKLLEEPYTTVNSNLNLVPTEVLENYLFVIDDNRFRYYGSFLYLKVSCKNVVGRVLKFR